MMSIMRLAALSVVMLFCFLSLGIAGGLLTPQQREAISNEIGKNWKLEQYLDEIELTSNSKLWFYNCVSLPYFPDRKKFYDEVVQGGRKDFYRIRFLFVLRWSPEKVRATRENNERINKKIYELPQKYRLDHLPRNKMNSFFSDDPEEKKRIAQYEEERDNLEAKIIILPDFHAGKHSVFRRTNRRGFECVWIPEGDTLSEERIVEILRGEKLEE